MTLILLISKVQITLKCSGLLVSALSSGWNSPDLSPGQGHCVMFLGETLCSHPGGVEILLGHFPFTKNFGKFLLGISVWEKRVSFVTSPIHSQALLCCFSESPMNIQNGGQ